MIKKKDTYEELQISICSAYNPKSVANDVEVSIPVPSDCTDVISNCKAGTATYIPGKNLVQWRLFAMKGQEKRVLNLNFKLPSIKSGKVKRESILVPNGANQYFLPNELSLHEWTQSKEHENQRPKRI